MAENKYAVAQIDASQLPEGFFEGEKYKVLDGRSLPSSLGLDQDYFYAVYPDGHVEVMYATTKPMSDSDTTDAATDSGVAVDPTTAKPASELGVDMSQLDKHGVPLGKDGYNALGHGLRPSGSADDVLGAVTMGAATGFVAGAANFGSMLAEGLQGLLGEGVVTITPALESALGKGAMTLLTTGDPLQAITSGTLSFGLGSVDIGGPDLAGDPNSVLPNGMNVAEEASTLTDLAGDSGGLIGSQMEPIQTAGVSSSVTGTMTDSPIQWDSTVPAADAVPGAQATMPPAVLDTPSINAMDGASGGSKGVIGRLLDWGQENQTLAAGALLAAGGAGTALLNRQNLQDQISAQERLQDQRTRNAEELEQFKRDMVRSGSFFDAKLPTDVGAPQGPKPLRRPDGSLVYSRGGGIIGRRTGG